MNELPDKYEPYQKIKICSNYLIGGGVLFSIGDQFPLLIGTGELPKIWLSALENPDSKRLVSIVEESRSVHELVKMEQIDSGYVVTVFDKTILKILVRGDGVPEISILDLRYIGFNISGNSSGLQASGMTIKNSTFGGVSVMIGFD